MMVLMGEISFSQENFIQYTFDKELDEAIRSHLGSQLASDSTRKFFFTISRSSDGKNCDNHLLFIDTYTDRPLYFVYDIISKSTRYYLFDGRKIPICFDYDFQFIGYGSNKRGITRKHVTGNPYFIEFIGSSGKVIRKGI
jgi:hypothetical protein